MNADGSILATAFARTRWGYRFADRDALERWQSARVNRFVANVVPRAPFYRGRLDRAFDELPVVDKAVVLRAFEQFNTRGVSLAAATDAALAAESTEADDGRPRASLAPDLSVGLSSGTQGPRGVFIVSARERARWAGILLARTLSRELLRDLIGRRAPLRVAFFLRANNRLYTTLAGRRIDFRFFDLQCNVDTHLTPLRAFGPEILVAPPSVLAWIARDGTASALASGLRRVIAVAEVLEPDDVVSIRAAFGLPVHQLYQCTEGFLGYTCEHGTLHLNEEFVRFEREWLDAERTRFVPIVTDFSRETQLIVRHRMTDVLLAGPQSCPCGRVTQTIAAIEGRTGDVLWLRASDGSGLTPLFPDALRHVLARLPIALPDYRIAQHGDALQVAVAGDERPAFESLSNAIDELATRQGLRPPRWMQVPMTVDANAIKRRRIVCIRRPGRLAGETSSRGS